jgi:hypothetical protein
LLGKLDGKSLERPRRRWEDNIRIHRREIGWESVDWIHLVQDDGYRSVVNTVMNLRTPQRAEENFLTS